ncbi:MobV family relaxase [Vibrio parahaemolyticus]|uniref:Plasmid recombination enzyme n=2 Tax=Vibrio parahaemolyticus TaxID=670 RepID=A0A7Y0XC24_VIBPH|nr:MobV family relaxase [Vibrio parahaemolyticus]EJB8582657.1 plasmid recombination protein [Vibrio parahaemolyticus]MCS0044152.1 plasmid recombination protein [Vibrio parahaemolyticus]MDF4556600.1 MobV family relaxase [Vibrio parahaemolyticus]MDF5016858.1 MobV family relaxase [Vibrio parahaemolyticus]MDF5096054.1 MobV family relaxase [Vibrio parahaemolyticus]
MNTTILRFEKHKHFANIRQAGAHQHRHHANTLNADKCRSNRNRIFIGSSNLVSDVKNRLKILQKKTRKNAVLAVDGVLTLSPALFRQGNREDQYQTLKKFAIASKRWLIQTFGENVVNAVLHLDETSPHVHFTVVPIERTLSGEYKLNARNMFNKQTLHDFQRNYFELMQQCFPELVPPKYREKATHTTLRAFYAGLNRLDGKITDFIETEFNQQKDKLRVEAETLIRQHIEEWLEQRFVNMPDDKIDSWVASVQKNLGWELDVLVDQPTFKPSLNETIKTKIILN